MFLEGKQEASGLPERISTNEEIDAYILDYFNHEGILLDKNNIELNVGMRALMNILLNAFWG
jgi:hypothetical protein